MSPSNLLRQVGGGGLLIPYLCGAGAILCWASLAAAIGGGLQAAAPETVLFYGLLVSALALTLREGLRRKRLTPSWPGWRVAFYGVYGIWGYHTLLVVAFSMAPALEVNVLNYSWTLWIVLLGSFVPGHRPTLLVMLGGLLGFAGVALVLGGEEFWGLLMDWGGLGEPGSPLASGGEGMGSFAKNLPGYLLALAAGLCWGSFTAFMRVMVPPNVPRMDLFCLLATCVAGAFLALRGAPWLLPMDSVGPVLFLGLVPLGLSFLLWEQAAQRCNVQILGMMSFFTPVLSTLLLSWVSETSVPPLLYAGLALILGGAALGGKGVGRES